MFNRAFDEMRKAALRRLDGRDIQKIISNAGVDSAENGSILRFNSFGTEIQLHCPEWEFTPELDPWHSLTLLHCFDLADGTPLTGRWIPMAGMKNGMVRGGGFDRKFEETLIRLLGNANPEETENACLRMGGSIVPGNADLCAEFLFAPAFPILVKIWFADEDFPPSGRMFVDSASDHYLTIEDAVTVGEIFLTMFENALRNG